MINGCIWLLCNISIQRRYKHHLPGELCGAGGHRGHPRHLPEVSRKAPRLRRAGMKNLLVTHNRHNRKVHWFNRQKDSNIVLSIKAQVYCDFCMLVPKRGWQCEEMLHPPFGFQCQLLLNCRYEIIISDLCENLDSLDEPDAKAAMIWIVGEYAERSPAGWHMVTCTCVRFAGVPIDQKTELAEQLSLETRNQGKDGENSGAIQFSSFLSGPDLVCFVLMSLHFYCVDVGNSHIAVIPALLANSLLLAINFFL